MDPRLSGRSPGAGAGRIGITEDVAKEFLSPGSFNLVGRTLVLDDVRGGNPGCGSCKYCEYPLEVRPLTFSEDIVLDTGST